jgi:hypothetical protein
MTRGKDIIGIFRQNWPFWHSLIVWGVQLVHLVVQGATLKTAGSLGVFFNNFPLNFFCLFSKLFLSQCKFLICVKISIVPKSYTNRKK